MKKNHISSRHSKFSIIVKYVHEPGNRHGNFRESKSDAKAVLEAGNGIFIPLLSGEGNIKSVGGVETGNTRKAERGRTNASRFLEIVPMA